jgi:hypothetical protein
MERLSPFTSIAAVGLSSSSMTNLVSSLGEPDPLLGGWTVAQLCSVAFPVSGKIDAEALVGLVLAAVHEEVGEEAFFGFLVHFSFAFAFTSSANTHLCLKA